MFPSETFFSKLFQLWLKSPYILDLQSLKDNISSLRSLLNSFDLKHSALVYVTINLRIRNPSTQLLLAFY